VLYIEENGNPLGPDFSVLRCLGSLNTNYIVGRDLEIFKNSFFEDENSVKGKLRIFRNIQEYPIFNMKSSKLINYLTEAALVLCSICLHGQ